MELEPHIWFPIIIILFLCVTILPISRSEQPDGYSECYYPFQCGNWIDLRYPFWSAKLRRPSYCGGEGFELHCPENESEYPSITFHSQTFNITSIHYDSYRSLYNMKMVRADVAYDNCSSHLTDTSLSTSKDSEIIVGYGSDVKNVTLFYDCPVNISGEEGLYNFTCQPQYANRVYYVHEGQIDARLPQLGSCWDRIQVPISSDIPLPVGGNISALNKYLNQGFHVTLEDPRCIDCHHSGGICGSHAANSSQFICHCQNGDHNEDCDDDSNQTTDSKFSQRDKAIVASVACLLTAIVILGGCGYYIYRRRKRSSYAKSIIQSSQATSSVFSSKMQDSELGSKSYVVGVHVFTYTELEEATDHFNAAKELGDGGFGTVYFGKLQDGRCVAVKRLYENNYKRVEQFMNEVEILSTLRHQNLVSLYGCTSRHSRELLLVYEYIPNGTVADHLHGELAKPGSMPWSTRMNIAIETASALVYLHAKDIIHRDVKTNNILLDNHFCVKVADFGLSRLFPEHVTHISTAPQGTPGYVDPEYHECYQLTHKSDVYSFGVVLIELISSMPAVDITRHRHEINLSTMAINKIQNRALHELVDPTLGFESDYKVRKMINGVAELAFQCLQSMKDLRPSMEEVLDVLRDIESDGKLKEGKAEVMDISADDVGLLKNDMAPPLPSPDSNMGSKSTTPNTSN